MTETWAARDAVKVHVGLALLTLLLFAGVVFLGETFCQRDALTIHQPWRGYALDRLASGEWPEWFDGVGLGVAAASNPLYGATYPLTWALVPFPSAWAVDFLFVFHVFLAGAGVARLSRRFGASATGGFLAGATMIASGYTVSLVVMGIPLLTLAWTPHVLHAVDVLATAERGDRLRAGLGLAGCFALQLSSGDPAAVITSSLLVLVLVGVRARPLLPGAARVGVACLAGLPLAAVMLLPAYHYGHDTARYGGLGDLATSVWTLHPLRALEWIWPNVFGDPSRMAELLSRVVADTGVAGDLEPHFAMGMYLSLPILLLGVLGLGGRDPDDVRRRRLLLIGIGVCLVLALGSQTFLYDAYRAVFLPEQLVRYPERHFGGALVLWSVAVGVGFTRLLARGPTRKQLVVAAAALAGLAALVGAAHLWRADLAAFLRARDHGPYQKVLVDDGLDFVLPNGVAAVIASALALVTAWMLGRASLRRFAPGLGVLVIVGHLFMVHAGFPLTLSRDFLLAMPEWLAPALAEDRLAPSRHLPRARVYRDSMQAHVRRGVDGMQKAVLFHLSLGDRLLPFFELAEVPGYAPIGTVDADFLWKTSDGPGLERFLDAFDVKWLLLPGEDERIGDKPVHAESEQRYKLVENRGRRPHAFVVGRWQWLPSIIEAGTAMVQARFDFEAARLEGSGPAPSPEAAGQRLRHCDVSAPRPEHVVVDCNTQGGYLVLLEAWAPGWQASVDGRPVPIHRADAMVRAVPIPAGEHRVEMRYRTPGLRTGVAISAAAWLLWLGLVVAYRLRPRG